MTPTEAAWQAAEAIRVLNHLTLPVTGSGEGYTYPGDLDAVLGFLQALTTRLPQTFGQAASWLAGQHHRGRIGHDQLSPGHGRDRILDRSRRQCHARRLADTPITTSVEDDAGTAEAVSALCTDLRAAAEVSVKLTGILHDARTASVHLTGGMS